MEKEICNEDKVINEKIISKAAKWSIIIYIIILVSLFLPAFFIRVFGN